MKLHVLYILFVLFSFSCAKEKRKALYYNDLSTESAQAYYDTYEVPFREENGVKYIEVKVNGVDFEMIFDTGCSTTLLSLAEAKYLYDKGRLTEKDFIGMSKSQIADGSIVENMVVNLEEVIIGNQISCENVKAVVVKNVKAPLLLGNEVLDRLATITINNESNTLKFDLK